MAKIAFLIDICNIFFSFSKNAAKKNKKNQLPRITNLNRLTRNCSFVYDNYSNKVDVKYEPDDSDDDYEKKGYWGYMRDKKADRQRQQQQRYSSKNNLLSPSSASTLNPSQTNEYDGYWGLFKDSHLDLSKSSPVAEIKKANKIEKNAKFNLTFDSDDSQTSSHVSSNVEEAKNSAQENKLPKKIVYDYKRFKIEAQKRDE